MFDQPDRDLTLPQRQSLFHWGGRVEIGIWRAQEPSGKTPVLFLNGFGFNMELAGEFAAAFKDRDFVSFDAPGIGRSDPSILPYTAFTFAQLASRVIDEVGYDEVDVIGYSWGGAMATQLALQHSKQIRKLILIGAATGATTIPGDWHLISDWLVGLAPSQTKTMEAKLQSMAKTATRSTTLASRVVVPSAWGLQCQIMACSGWSSLPGASMLTLPVHIMASAGDPMVPLSNAQMLHATIPGSKLHVIQRAGHIFPFTRPVKTAGQLSAFLDGPASEAARKIA